MTTPTTRAYQLSVEADHAAIAGDLVEARRLMNQAASIDGGYRIRATHVGEADARRTTPLKTLTACVIEPLVVAGCRVVPPGRWAVGSYLERIDPPWTLQVTIGRDKFGHRISCLAVRWTEPAKVEGFPFANVGLASAHLAYATQRELESVCREWRDVLMDHVLPWGTGRGTV